MREGGICYLDEVVEARKDVTVVLHPLTDDRRILPLDRTGEELVAPPGFMLVVSYNPGYQSLLKALKPSTRQRFIAIELDFCRRSRKLRSFPLKATAADRATLVHPPKTRAKVTTWRRAYPRASSSTAPRHWSGIP